MSATKIRLGDRTTMTLFNPFPTITEKEFMKREPKIRFYQGHLPSDAPIFKIDIRYGSSEDTDYFTLAPGEEVSLPIHLSQTLHRLGEEQGLAICSSKASPEEQEDAARNAFAKRLEWESTNGSKPLQRRQMSYKDDEWGRIRYQRHAALVINTAREQLVEALLDAPFEQETPAVVAAVKSKKERE